MNPLLAEIGLILCASVMASLGCHVVGYFGRSDLFVATLGLFVFGVVCNKLIPWFILRARAIRGSAQSAA